MSCFNSEETVSTSIQSLISQDYKNTEILIMDDGSSDNTFKILKTFEDSYKNIKVYQNKKNIGLTRSLNILIQKRLQILLLTKHLQKIKNIIGKNFYSKQ